MARLEAAVRAGDVAGVAAALEGVGEDPSALDAELDVGGVLGRGGSLHLASFLGCLPVMKALLHGPGGKSVRRGGGGGSMAPRVALERGTTTGAPALVCAAFAGHEAAVALLLHQGADTAATTSIGTTALVLATMSGHTAVAALLLDHGADIAAANASDGRTALMIAAQLGHTATAALLLDRGAPQPASATAVQR